MTLNANATVTINATAESAPEVGAGLYTIENDYAVAALVTGAGLNQANQIWSDIGSIPPDDFDQINIRTPSATDQLGQALAFSKIKLIFIKNRSVVAGVNLGLGDEGITTDRSWNSIFGGSDAGHLVIPSGGSLLLIAPDANGFAVEENTNDILAITNPGSEALEYEIILIGS
jgi:hypothetical protein